MTREHETFREQMVDYLYDELHGEALREFEARLARSEADRRELEALQRTLQRTRGVRSALDVAPPARVRDAVLAAAAQASAERALSTHAGGATSSVDHAARTHAPSPTLGQRLAAWLRTPWLVPALGAAAVLAFVIVRPRSREALAPPSAPSSPHAREDTSASGGAEPAPRRSYESAAEVPVSESKEERRARAPAQKRATRSFAAPPPEPSASVRYESESEARTPHEDRLGSADSLRAASSGRADKAELLQARGAEPGTFAASPAAPAKSADRASEPPAEAAPAVAAGSAEERTGAARAPDTLVERAHELMLARRFREAASAYRELLRRYPDDTRARAWQKQLILANQAIQQGDR